MARLAAAAAALFAVAATQHIVAAAGLVIEEATNDWTTNNLVVSYDSLAGLHNIEQHVGRAQQQGSVVGITGATTFKLARPITAEMAANYQTVAAAAFTSGRKLLHEIESAPKIVGKENLGFVYVATDSAAEAEAQFRDLLRLEGVTTVERDVVFKDNSNGNSDKREMSSRRLTTHNEGFEDNCTLSDMNENECIPYGIQMINITHLWDKVPKEHVKVCVIDTGYNLGHPDLPNGTSVTGWHPKVSPAILSFQEQVAFGTWNDDEDGHGTHVAGTIGAVGGNGKGVVGVLRDPSWFSLHVAKGLGSVLEPGSSRTLQSSFMDAINSCVAEGSHVINMSLRCLVATNQDFAADHCYLVAYEQFLDDVYDQNIIMVGAAGNENRGRETFAFPQSHKSVISVANIDGKGERSYDSEWNEQVELSGPGTDVWSTESPSTYQTRSGTSMAAPHVAGVAAFLISHFPDCTNNQIRNAIIRSATKGAEDDPYNSPGWNPYYGWGIVNAGLAYELLDQGCKHAGGASPYQIGLDRLSEMALGGKNQTIIGCLNDDQCEDENPCRVFHSCKDYKCVYQPKCGADLCCPNTGECAPDERYPQCKSPICSNNTEDWTDAVGDTCDWYSSVIDQYRIPREIAFEVCNKYEGKMGLAAENCCICKDPRSPTSSPTSYGPSTQPSFTPSLLPSLSLFPTSENTITVSIWPDGSSGENYYNIKDVCTGELVFGSDFSGLNTDTVRVTGRYEYEFYNKTIPVGPSQYMFSIYDTFGDGICCGNSKHNSLEAELRLKEKGSFIVKYNGDTVAVGGDFDYEFAETFGETCTSSVSPTSSPTRAKSRKRSKSYKFNLLSEELDSGAQSGGVAIQKQSASGTSGSLRTNRGVPRISIGAFYRNPDGYNCGKSCEVGEGSLCIGVAGEKAVLFNSVNECCTNIFVGVPTMIERCIGESKATPIEEEIFE